MINPLQIDARLPWLLPALLSLVAIFVLSIAWISELYGANLQLFDNRNLNPCQLCIVQRYPYALIVVLGAAATLLSNRAMERTLLLSVISIVLVFGSYVSGFHIGVEYGWWTAGS
ncbi:MAG: disulfide bond formation protein B, partial [Alphaproteobacteria bacterium]